MLEMFSISTLIILYCVPLYIQIKKAMSSQIKLKHCLVKFRIFKRMFLMHDFNVSFQFNLLEKHY